MMNREANKQQDRIIITDPTSDRYYNLRLIDWWDQEKLIQSSVMVVGCGALGNEVLKNLALVGVGKIFLVDFDEIDASNLTRSVLFRITDVGKQKVKVAAERIKDLNPDVQTIACNADIITQVGAGVYRRMDVVIGCLDNREARLVVNRNCWQFGVPWVDGGLLIASGQLRAFIPPEGPCYECTMTEKDYQLIRQRYACTGIRREDMLLGRVPTGTAIASIIGAMQAQEAIKLIHGISATSGEGITYNSMTRQFYPLKYQRRADCPSHENYHPIIELQEKSENLTVGQFLKIAAQQLGDGATLQLDRDILTNLTCLNCRRENRKVKNYRELKAEELNCPVCNIPMLPDITHLLESGTWLDNLTLAELGIPLLHIIGARNGDRLCYFELSGDERQVIKYK